MRNRFLQTKTPIAYADALQLQEAFMAQYPEAPAGGEGVNYYLRTRTEQVNSTKANIFITHAAMLYGGIVLMVICLTILSLQQLLDASKYRYRFGILRKMGVEERDIEKLVIKQLGIWFGLPVTIAVLTVIVLAAFFFTTIRQQIDAYIGLGTLSAQVALTVLVLLILLVCYLISTWILFRNSVEE